MEKGMQIFHYQDQEVRTVEQGGEPWWVLADVCKALGMKEPHRVSARLDDDEKGRTFVTTPGGAQELTIINEPGLYTVILRSNKPEAKSFKRWITHEVLPAIRRTGQYRAAPAEQGSMDRLAQAVERLESRLDSLGVFAGQSAAAAQAAQELPTGPCAQMEAAEDKRAWMQEFSAKLELLSRYMGTSRNGVLHNLYLALEYDKSVSIKGMQIYCMEQYGLERCSGVEAIYYHPRVRRQAEYLMDCVLRDHIGKEKGGG